MKFIILTILFPTYFLTICTITEAPIPCFAPSTRVHLLWPSPHYRLGPWSTHICIYVLWLIFSSLPTPPWDLSVCSMNPCLWSYFFCQFILFIKSYFKNTYKEIHKYSPLAWIVIYAFINFIKFSHASNT